MHLVSKIKNFFFHGVPNPATYYPEPKVMYVAGTHQAFRNWQELQINDAEDNRPYYDPYRAVHVRRVDAIRGRQFAPDQFIRLHDYRTLSDWEEIESYAQLAHILDEANRQDAE